MGETPSIWQAVLASALIAAIISGSVQLISGRLQRQHDERRERQRDRKQIYVACIELLFQIPITETSWPGKQESSTALEEWNRLRSRVYTYGSRKAVVAVDRIQEGINAFYRESAKLWTSWTEPIGIGDRMDVNQKVWQDTLLPELMILVDVVRDEIGIESLTGPSKQKRLM